MALNPGRRFGPYTIVAPLGAGGMGEVYKAHDSSLNREVALKILPDTFSADPDRVARFSREAQTLALLNHPHIAAIYGLQEIESPSPSERPMRALVLELVDGDTLAARLKIGPLPMAEALAYARQIADALEAAHERGIVHRDVKPANIVITPDDIVKVLDFGLAKIAPSDLREADSPHSPTQTLDGTREGVIIGTAAYMSPEQAKGRPVDKRADLWAFGAVLYEMLAGRKAFRGDNVSEILAQVLTQQPDWQQLPAGTPGPIVKLLRRCLETDRKQRLDSATVARLEIDEALTSPAVVETTPAVGRRTAAWAIPAAIVIAVVAFGAARTILQSSLPPAQTSRLAIVLPPLQLMPSLLLDRDLAISPDGRYVVFRVGGSVAGGPLALRALDQQEAQLLTGIDNARSPFFSADSRWIGFFSGSELKKVSIKGGPAMTILRNMPPGRSASWGDDDTIALGGENLLRVSAADGTPIAPTGAESAEMPKAHFEFTDMLPGGRGVLFMTRPPGQSWFSGTSDSEIAVLDLRTGQRKTLIRGGFAPRYIPGTSQAGYLVYASAGTLLAARFDLGRLEVLGDPVPVVERLAMAPGGAVNYDVSRNGTLVYVPAGAAASASRTLVWVDREGNEAPTGAPRHAYAFVRLSPDGTRVALSAPEERRIWIWDLARKTLQALSFGSSEDEWPIWTHDSRSIVFTSDRAGVTNLYSQLADGSGPAQRLTTSPNQQYPNSISRDGRHILAAEVGPSTRLDIVVLTAASSKTTAGAAPGPPMPLIAAGTLVQTAASEYDAILSPDNRFFAYQSNESSRTEIYVKRFPEGGDVRWRISTAGGSAPAWAPNGRELYYRDPSNAVIAVPVDTTGGAWRTGTPAKLLDAKYAAPTDMFSYDVAPDGRFLMLKETGAGEAAAPANIVVVLNWLEELKGRLPTK